MGPSLSLVILLVTFHIPVCVLVDVTHDVACNNYRLQTLRTFLRMGNAFSLSYSCPRLHYFSASEELIQSSYSTLLSLFRCPEVSDQ